MAIPMALAVEGARSLKWKCELSDADNDHIADFCSVLLLGTVLYISASNRTTKTLLLILQWLPLPLFPLALFQSISTRPSMDVGSLFWLYRKTLREKYLKFPKRIDIRYPYLATCLLAASIANNRSPVFYLSLCILTAWALFPFRCKRFSLPTWVTLLLVVSAAGYAGHMGLHLLQQKLEERFTSWFTDFIRIGTDPYKSTTSLGDILTLKKSGNIIIRVRPEKGENPPDYLRTGTYNIFNASAWFSSDRFFIPLLSNASRSSWNLGKSPINGHRVMISCFLKDDELILPLPLGTYKIINLPVLGLQRNRLGTVKAEEGPYLISYQALYNDRQSLDAPPDSTDMKIPQSEQRAVSRVANELNLLNKTPKQVLDTLNIFFRTKFTYSLRPPPNRNSETPITYFLLHGHEGHCEYFASATVLLLRYAGIPARYATGFVVREYSSLEKAYIIRQRHAHAWSLAYVDNRWQNFDTTPQDWFGYEKNNASNWEGVHDVWERIKYLYYSWKWGERKSSPTKYMVWLLIPLALLFVARLYSRNRFVRDQGCHQKPSRMTYRKDATGMDSEFYLIIDRLHAMGFDRHEWETLSEWLTRIGNSNMIRKKNGQLETILKLHYRYRFDPQGLGPAEKKQLEEMVRSWLEKFER